MEQIYITYIVALLAILDPIGIIPFYLTASSEVKAKQQLRLALTLGGFVFLCLLVFLFTGTAILSFFGISLPAFQIAGGIILLLLGIEMIKGAAQTPEKKNLEMKKTHFKSVFAKMIVPIGIPLFVGPGSISTVVLYSSKLNSFDDKLQLAGLTAIVCAIVVLVLMMATKLQRKLGKTGLDVATRIMGLILAAIAVQFLIDGVTAAFNI